MKLTKKLLSVLLCLPILFAVGCKSTKKTVEAEAEDDYLGPKPAYSKHVAIPDTSSSVITAPQAMHDNLTALDMTRLMGNGINLSNTMEAYRTARMGVTKPASDYEVLWGQPVTTQALMNSYKAAGFDSVRIPVAWTNGMDYENGDYTIAKTYLDRIETIVNYALNANLIVVFNDHWDGDWWGMFGSNDAQTRKDAMELYTSMWTQLANRFKNYSDSVIFEGGNEEIGNRLNDITACYDSGFYKEDTNANYKIANEINQAFVDIVRKTGGNNANRFLLIPGYNTDISMTVDERIHMTTDTAKNKLIVSVHYYTPWGYCGGPSVNHWGTTKEVGEMNTLLTAMADFVDQGYGVIIGEYGVFHNAKKEKKPNMEQWLNNFLDNCDVYNYCPMLWDTGDFFDRTAGQINDAEIAKIYLTRNYAEQSKMTQEQISDKAQTEMDDLFDNAPELLSDNQFVGATDKSVAWIMYNDQSWTTTYSVGDSYNPDSKSDGIKATDVQITGPGTYTVGREFTGLKEDGTGSARSFAFAAIGISNGEQLFPNYVIDIKEFLVDGKPYTLTAKPFTSSDDKKCTRCNIYNEWVTSKPKDARTADGDLKGAKAIIVRQMAPELAKMHTLTITFEWKPAPENIEK